MNTVHAEYIQFNFSNKLIDEHQRSIKVEVFTADTPMLGNMFLEMVHMCQMVSSLVTDTFSLLSFSYFGA